MMSGGRVVGVVVGRGIGTGVGACVGTAVTAGRDGVALMGLPLIVTFDGGNAVGAATADGARGGGCFAGCQASVEWQSVHFF